MHKLSSPFWSAIYAIIYNCGFELFLREMTYQISSTWFSSKKHLEALLTSLMTTVSLVSLPKMSAVTPISPSCPNEGSILPHDCDNPSICVLDSICSHFFKQWFIYHYLLTLYWFFLPQHLRKYSFKPLKFSKAIPRLFCISPIITTSNLTNSFKVLLP